MQNIVDVTDNDLSDILGTLIVRVHNYKNDTQNCNASEIALIVYFTKTFSSKTNYLSYFLKHKDEIMDNLKIIYPQISENMSYMDHNKLFCILNYLVLVNKYHDSFLNKPFNYQLDIVFAITDNNISHTNFDNIVPILLNDGVYNVYSKINNIFRKYTILEELLSINGGYNAFNIKRATNILKGYIIPAKPFDVDVEFNLDNLYAFFMEVQAVNKENNINTYMEDYDFSSILQIKAMPNQIRESFLSSASGIFSSVMSNEEKAKLIMMLVDEFLKEKNNIIDFNQIKKG
jgi:hypothetical protein